MKPDKYTCEKCHVRFPEKDERYGQCRECNEAEGYCYDCEIKDDKYFQAIELNAEMLKMLKKLHNNCPNHRGEKRRKLGELIAKVEKDEIK
tara:strand:+ start:86 stop:358 length:273 start_codon:yes stop_codon:yes gene_type:complete